MTVPPTAVHAVHISKTFGNRKAVVDVSFDVQPGEVLGLIGPNGAGKTTVIRMLVGLSRPSSGSVSLFGHDTQRDFEAALGPVGAIVENPEMYKFFSGRQNLQQYARMRPGITEGQIDKTVALVGLTERIDEKITRYSLGMRQRLGIAQALLHDPQLLILDEPTNGLDPQGIQELRQLIRSLADSRGMAVLLSSHLLHDVQAVCDSITVINLGRTVASGNVSSFTEGKKAGFKLTVSDIMRSVELAKSSGWAVSKSDAASGQLVVESELEVSALNELLVISGVKVSRIEAITRSLEDAFLELTNSGSSPGTGQIP
jgi:ABC-2 type transport system ATP-binding protein